ncbi:MAG: hypothetical protein HZA13_04780 [Nitrospirae bacterium]|nr:hypothetical protein [Nitrospirota bacterium]
MTGTIQDFLKSIMEYKGSLVERMEDDSLEAIIPTEVSGILDIPEHARFSFSYDADQKEAIYASYDSELFKSIIKLLGDRGRFSCAAIETTVPNPEKISNIVQNKISLNNAIFRLDKTEIRRMPYLLIGFKYTALSDEKQEGITAVLINKENLSTNMPENGLYEILERLMESDEEAGIYLPESPKIFQAAYSAAAETIKRRLSDFVKSLERRLNRDVRRVYEYYETLEKETIAAIKRKAASEGQDMGLLDRQIKERTIKGEGQRDGCRCQEKGLDSESSKQRADASVVGRGRLHPAMPVEGDGRSPMIDKLLNKLDAIEAERNWKAQDLISKYSLSLKIEPVSAIGIVTDVPVFWINIKRRLSSRDFPVTYNTIVRQFDPLPCESCFNPQQGYFVCDEKLHIICGNCFRACARCGKPYCRTCHKETCPRCKNNR